MSIRSLKDSGVIQTRKSFEGTKIKLAELENKEVVILDFVELDSKLPAGGTYLLISLEDAGTKYVTTTSSKVIKDVLSKAKSILPIRCTVKHNKSKSGPFSYWTLE